MSRAELAARLLELADDVKALLDEEAAVDGDDRPVVLADVLLVIGGRGFIPEGGCFGTVYVFSDENNTPGYVARGLLLDAVDTVVEDRP